MKILFEKKFLKDIEALRGNELKQRIADVIRAVEHVATIHEVVNLKKMKGHKSAYRIRIGEYRLGCFIENHTFIFVRFLHRKDIYSYFPEYYCA